ncbi:MAG: glycosyltransferase family 39 protein [Flavobacteriales bacterium]|nr:glycosyltransferase family 39 protein [Flavobacteriales bacterium]
MRLPVATLALVLLFGGLLRFHAIDRFGTGFDELFSVLEANGLHPGLAAEQEPFMLADLREHDNFQGAANACIATDGGNGIMYILALHAWTDVFGNSNMAIRLFSFCCGIMVVVLVFRLARELSGDGVQACLAAGLAALAPILVDYSQESRSYMLATAITLQATRQFIKLVRSEHGSRKQGPLYGFISGLALLCHYHAAYILAGHALFALFRIPFKRHALWSLPAASVAIAILGCWLVAGGWLGMMSMARHHARYAAGITSRIRITKCSIAPLPQSTCCRMRPCSCSGWAAAASRLWGLPFALWLRSY